MDRNLILCAVDAGPEREPTLRMAALLAAELGAELLLIHVVPEWPFGPAMPISTPEHRDWVAFAAGERGEPVRLELLAGDPAEIIVDYAQRSRCRLVVLGSRARAAVQYSLGSVAARVVSCAPCPVLVIPPGAQRAPDLDGKAA
ncbi:MAG TPA: universal stress protein [Myxococcales bacterium]|nr:universal stress protein [Myxococcales bacterium]